MSSIFGTVAHREISLRVAIIGQKSLLRLAWVYRYGSPPCWLSAVNIVFIACDVYFLVQFDAQCKAFIEMLEFNGFENYEIYEEYDLNIFPDPDDNVD